MPAYVLFMNDIQDKDGYKEYMKGATPWLHGGTPKIFADSVTVLEGDPNYGRVIAVEFPTREQAEAWYNSPEYQAVIPQRQAAAPGWCLIVDGL
jgi:uncharacterized protein (DUF1330 family)